MMQNQSEEIIDKDNHARDAMKYVVMSMPDPTQKTQEEKLEEKLQSYKDAGVNEYSLNIYRMKGMMQMRDENAPIQTGRRHGAIITKR